MNFTQLQDVLHNAHTVKISILSSDMKLSYFLITKHGRLVISYKPMIGLLAVHANARSCQLTIHVPGPSTLLDAGNAADMFCHQLSASTPDSIAAAAMVLTEVCTNRHNSSERKKFQ